MEKHTVNIAMDIVLRRWSIAKIVRFVFMDWIIIVDFLVNV